jgi:segregation and condensation protein B
MKNNLKSQIESLLLVAENPLSLKEIAHSLSANATAIEDELKSLVSDYKERGIRIIKQKDSYILGTAPENSELVSIFLNEELKSELSASSLEVLAIVVYKQPVTRAEIEEIRGTDSSRNIRILLMRGMIEERGRKESPGRPILYGTSIKLLTHLGIQDEEELPKIEFNPEPKSG